MIIDVFIAEAWEEEEEEEVCDDDDSDDDDCGLDWDILAFDFRCSGGPIEDDSNIKIIGHKTWMW